MSKEELQKRDVSPMGTTGNVPPADDNDNSNSNTLRDTPPVNDKSQNQDNTTQEATEPVDGVGAIGSTVISSDVTGNAKNKEFIMDQEADKKLKDSIESMKNDDRSYEEIQQDEIDKLNQNKQ